MEKTYTTFQVAEICGVKPTTVIKWANQHKIKVFVTPGGHRRILESDLLGFLREYNFPIPTDLTGKRMKILLVEDDLILGNSIRKALEKAANEVDVEWIKDGVEALLALGSRAPDLIIIDVVMPVVDGSRVLASLKADSRTSRVKVIGIANDKVPLDKLKFMQCNTDGFLLKPLDPKDLACQALVLLGLHKKPKLDKLDLKREKEYSIPGMN